MDKPPRPGQKAGARGERRLTAFPILQFGANRFPQAHVDLFVYVGDLAPLFGAAASALTSDGLFAFSVESCDGGGFRLEPTMRFAHARPYVEATARALGLRPVLVESASARREAGADALGLIGVVERQAGG